MADTTAIQDAENPTPAHQVLTLVFGAAMGQIVAVAGELNIADFLVDGPKTAEELSQATNSNSRALKSILRALVSVGIFRQTDTGAFTLNELGELLRSDKQESLAKYAFVANREFYHRMWSNLMHTVRTGESAFEDANGMNVYEFYNQHPDELTHFQQALSGQTHREAIAIRDAYDFSSIENVVDVGGGRGLLVRQLLEANPNLCATVFDLGSVVAGIKDEFAAAALSDRTNIVAGDFFQSIPGGSDLYIFKRIFIDKPDEQAARLLENCRSVVRPGAKLLIADPDIRTSYGKVVDVFMLGTFGAGIRTEDEWAPLLTQSNFEYSRTIDTDSTLMLIEATAV
jgi:SAM-dependent methyltransferase